MKIRAALAGLGVVALAAGLAGCSGSGAGDSGTSGLDGKVKGSILVLTNRTDIVNTTLQKYAKQFEAAYPGTTVKFQAITNYEQDVTTRLASGNAGDVALIPNAVSRNQLPQFFEPLGSESALKKQYRFVPNGSYQGKAYGIVTFGTTPGMVYNKTVWKDAGVTTTPTTPDQFLADLKQIKSKTSATPLYTNYKDQWPLTQWNGDPSMFGNANAVNDLTANKAPWSSTDNYVGMGNSVLFDAVHEGLTEKDPTTTAWESSKGYIATGKIATMYLGSWAVPQMQAAATTAGKSADEIGFMPFPYRDNGKAYSTLAADYLQGVTKSSSNKATAWAWIKWFSTKTDYAAINGGIGASVDSKPPASLSEFAAADVQYIEQNAAPKGKENLLNQEMKASQIDITTGSYLQKLIDVARGAASGTKQSYFNSLDQAWSSAVEQSASN